jgi:methionyl-tRNA synthetase
MSAGLALPKQIVVHGFLFNRGEKMSKSVGNVIDPFALVGHYGLDPLRYFLLREVPFGQDGNYSHEAIVARINADLANDLGNLAQRSLTMIAKNCEARIPTPGEFIQADHAILAQAEALVDKARLAMKSFALHVALAEIWRVVAEANRYFAAQEPWAKRKSDPQRMATILYVTTEVLRMAAILTQPFLPGTMRALLDLLGVPPGERDFAHIGQGSTPGRPLPPPAPIFPRYVEAEAAG